MLETNALYPLIVEVTMYKHNLGDNRLLSLVKRNARISKIKNSNNHFFVSCDDIQEIIANNFQDDLMHQDSLDDTELVNNITSAYFLDSVTRTFPNLKYIKFNVSKSKNYTRRVGNTISFEYKILHAKIDLPAKVSLEQLKLIQDLLIDIKFWNRDHFKPKPFIEISARDLISQITYHESIDNFMDTHSLAIELLLTLVDPKLETDDASVHVIVLR